MHADASRILFFCSKQISSRSHLTQKSYKSARHPFAYWRDRERSSLPKRCMDSLVGKRLLLTLAVELEDGHISGLRAL